jgi:hypothetical protein
MNLELNTRRYRMNPSDCLFHAFDHLLRRQGYSGTGTFLVLELVGPLPAADVQRALERALAAHPVTMAVPRTSLWRARPYWVCDRAPVPAHYTYDDLSQTPDWRRRADELCEERFSCGWDPATPPQVRLEHYRGPAGEHRLCLRWAHALLDADGARLFLAEMDRLGGGDGPPANLLPDDAGVDPLAGAGPLRRLRLMLRGLRDRSPDNPLIRGRLIGVLPDRPVASRRLRYIVRVWSPEITTEIRSRAAALNPAGPALYARHLAGATLRAAWRVHAELGQDLPACGMMFPMRLAGPALRPVRGNYLGATALTARRELLRDRRALGEHVARTLADHVAHDGSRASWAMQRLTAGLRVAQYRRVIRWETRRQPFLTGFSYLGASEPPLRRFLGADVTNLYGGGVISIPPAWNVTFARCGERLNLVMAWPEGELPERVVLRYADLLEAEVLHE